MSLVSLTLKPNPWSNEVLNNIYSVPESKFVDESTATKLGFDGFDADDNPWIGNIGDSPLTEPCDKTTKPPEALSSANNCSAPPPPGTDEAVISLTSMFEPETSTFFQLGILFLYYCVIDKYKLHYYPYNIDFVTNLGVKLKILEEFTVYTSVVPGVL